MSQSQSFLDKINPVMRLKIAVVVFVGVSFLLLLSMLMEEPRIPPPREVNRNELYTVAIPYRCHYSFLGDATLVFSGEYSSPETLVIIDPQVEPYGEFLPLDVNPVELESLLRQTLSLADISPEKLTLSSISRFEYSLLPALKFTFSFSGYEGICYSFMARQYSFTVACLRRKGITRSWYSRDVDRMAFLQLGKKYRTPILARPVIDSSEDLVSYDTIHAIRSELALGHKYYELRNVSPENLTHAITAFRRGFRMLAELDETNLISEKDSAVFFAALEERQRIFAKLRSNIESEYLKGNYGRVRELLSDMEDMAVLDSDLDWREWGKRQKEILAEKNP